MSVFQYVCTIFSPLFADDNHSNLQFTLYHRQLVDIHAKNDIPPQSHKDEYEYLPMPAQTIPPVGSNLLLHFLLHPDHASPNRVILPSIPKRKRNKLEPDPIKGSGVGWGIEVVNGTNQFKIFIYGLFACLTSMVFGIVWSVVKDDIQGGFGVAAFMIASFGFAIASLKASDL